MDQDPVWKTMEWRLAAAASSLNEAEKSICRATVTEWDVARTNAKVRNKQESYIKRLGKCIDTQTEHMLLTQVIYFKA